LEKQNKQEGKTEKQKTALKQEFKKTRQGLTAVEWFDKAVTQWNGKKYSDPKKAIEYLSQAITLAPSNANTYNNRGLAYANLQQYQQAIRDYTQAIKLDPADAKAYTNRGEAYLLSGLTAQGCRGLRIRPVQWVPVEGMSFYGSKGCVNDVPVGAGKHKQHSSGIASRLSRTR